ncbi:response regulator transcription factor [Neofamilia massiliensis]|uniref:response regulator transcription factor n=1 Tax=Neofamilia massiliensis TaxID=1673724 RepID=UPI0006BB7F5E|nr:response regulator transcription factor [Neofamilia massiliensis]
MIYIVEDDENIRELVKYTLESYDFNVKAFESGKNLKENLLEDQVELLILDIMLPGQDGISILKDLRDDKKTTDLPVILLTAKSAELDRVKGLDQGADDYITKPFSVLELVSRVKALLRRSKSESNTSIYKYNGLSLDENKREIDLEGKPIELTYKEFELLLYMLKNKGLVLDRETIISKVWGYDFQGETRTVDVHIATLRNKLGSWAKYIHTVRNIGYKIGD